MASGNYLVGRNFSPEELLMLGRYLRNGIVISNSLLVPGPLTVKAGQIDVPVDYTTLATVVGRGKIPAELNREFAQTLSDAYHGLGEEATRTGDPRLEAIAGKLIHWERERGPSGRGSGHYVFEPLGVYAGLTRADRMFTLICERVLPSLKK